MKHPKILLSQEELNLVCDAQWLLTKNTIIGKAKEMFAGLGELLREQVEGRRQLLPEAVELFSPKVFRGEYYQGLPYVMLDYPRVFTREHVFAMRTMFWWGNFFSVTLQLKGDYRRLFAEAISRNAGLLSRNDFYVSVSGDEWRHDFEPENYQPLLAGSNLLERGDFLKIAVRIPVTKWNEAAGLIAGHHAMLLGILTG